MVRIRNEYTFEILHQSPHQTRTTQATVSFLSFASSCRTTPALWNVNKRKHSSLEGINKNMLWYTKYSRIKNKSINGSTSSPIANKKYKTIHCIYSSEPHQILVQRIWASSIQEEMHIGSLFHLEWGTDVLLKHIKALEILNNNSNKLQ